MDNLQQKYAILGFPLEHSFSPRIHNTAFEKLGLNAHYQLYEIHPERFDETIAKIKKQNWSGFNITIPFKTRILPFLDEIEPLSEDIGAVNTVNISPDGHWSGYNTDYQGFLDPIREHLGRLHSCVMIGAGGAARAVAYGLLTKARLSTMVIINRTGERADQLARELGQKFDIQIASMTLDEADRAMQSDLLVNTTSVGMGDKKEASPVDPVSLIKPGGIAYDLIYNPSKTVFLQKAEHAGLKTINGMPMLIGQAAAAFEIWTGQAFPENVRKQLMQGR